MFHQVRSLIVAAALLSPIAVTAVHAEDAHHKPMTEAERQQCEKDKAEKRDQRADRAERREHRHEHHRPQVALK